MTLFSTDNFLNKFDKFREHLLSLDFKGEVNPEDGVLYPDISSNIPDYVLEELRNFVRTKFDVEKYNTPFIRRSLKDTPVPHQSHSDRIMGSHSLMFYLSKDKDIPKGSGTGLVKHIETGIIKDTGGIISQIAFKDTNCPDKWELYKLIEMRQNRVSIFDADLWHRAEPIGGFGDSTSNGRLVLTWFFTGKEKERGNSKKSN